MQLSDYLERTIYTVDMCENNNYDDKSKNELKALILSVKQGNQTAFPKLCSMYNPLLLSLTAHYKSTVGPEDLEEMNCDAISALYNAAMSYDEDQDGVEFGLYAKICIKNRLSTTYRAWRHRAKLQIVQMDKDNFENGKLDSVLFPVNDDLLKHVVERESLEMLCKRISDVLSDYENRIWWLYMSGMSAKDIAISVSKSEGIERSEKSVTNALYRIRQKLRRVLS